MVAASYGTELPPLPSPLRRVDNNGMSPGDERPALLRGQPWRVAAVCLGVVLLGVVLGRTGRGPSQGRVESASLDLAAVPAAPSGGGNGGGASLAFKARVGQKLFKAVSFCEGLGLSAEGLAAALQGVDCCNQMMFACEKGNALYAEPCLNYQCEYGQFCRTTLGQQLEASEESFDSLELSSDVFEFLNNAADIYTDPRCTATDGHRTTRCTSLKSYDPKKYKAFWIPAEENAACKYLKSGALEEEGDEEGDKSRRR